MLAQDLRRAMDDAKARAVDARIAAFKEWIGQQLEARRHVLLGEAALGMAGTDLVLTSVKEDLWKDVALTPVEYEGVSVRYWWRSDLCCPELSLEW